MNDASTPTIINTGPSPAGWHGLELVLRCERLYSLRRKGTLVDPGSNIGALSLGTLVHVGLAHIYAIMRANQEGVAHNYAAPFDAMREVSRMIHAEGLLGKAQEMVQAYVDHYRRETFRIAAVEQLLETTIAGHRYTAKADLITIDAAGRYWIYDHKTAHEVSAKTSKSFTLSGQFLGLYHLGARQYGPAFGGLVVNLIGKIEPYKFFRTTPDPAPWALANFETTVAGAHILMAEIDAGKTPVPVLSEIVCMTRYGECPAFEACRWG